MTGTKLLHRHALRGRLRQVLQDAIFVAQSALLSTAVFLGVLDDNR